MLDVVLALNSHSSVVKLFEVDEAFDGVPFRKSRDQAGSVFVDSADKIVRHPTYKMPLGALARI
jgi:hypothetical protein